MIIDPSQLSLPQNSQLVTGSVVPRPIAWVSTIAPDGSYNLAPFSYFMAIGADPPQLAFSVNWRVRANSKKDTLSNIEASGELVINVATEATAEKMNHTSGEWGPEVDEFSAVGLTPLPSVKVKAPRVAESPVNIECRLNQIVRLGSEKAPAHLIIVEAVLWHVRDDLLTPQNTIDVKKLHVIGRLSYNYYTRTNELFEMVRPQV